MKKVIVLLSGGIDSSFAAYLLKESGYYIKGLVLKMYEDFPEPTLHHNIAVLEKKLGIEIEIMDIRSAFKKEVIDYFIKTYSEVKTPNPCARCNPEIKFRFGLKAMKEYGFDFVATGHYADRGYYRNHLTLKQAKDRKKTQEYFLARIRPEHLKYILFPLANFTKEYIKKASLKIFPEIIPRRESQDICFLKDINVDEFLKNAGIEIHGNMIYRNRVVKENVNILSFTRGQRRGIEFATGHRVYVKNIDPERKIVEIGDKEELKTLSFTVESPLFYVPLDEIDECFVRVRYSKSAVPCTIKKMGNKLKVQLKEPLYTVTPGQLAVFYAGDYVLGSGWIDFLL